MHVTADLTPWKSPGHPLRSKLGREEGTADFVILQMRQIASPCWESNHVRPARGLSFVYIMT